MTILIANEPTPKGALAILKDAGYHWSSEEQHDNGEHLFASLKYGAVLIHIHDERFLGWDIATPARKLEYAPLLRELGQLARVIYLLKNTGTVFGIRDDKQIALDYEITPEKVIVGCTTFKKDSIIPLLKEINKAYAL
jgi:hypothetical protein